MRRQVPSGTVLVVAVLFAGVVSAQSQVEGRPAPAAPVLRLPVIVWASGVAADQATTYWFASHYGDTIHEENPLVQPLERHPVLLVAAGAAIDAASGWAAFRLIGSHHPRLAKLAFYGAAAYRAYLTVHNIRMMRLANDLRAPADAPGR